MPLATSREIRTIEKCGVQYVYLGIGSSICEVLSKTPGFLENNHTIKLKVNIDGVPLFRSSSSQFWPILGCFRDSKVFVIALFYGNAKPNSVKEYLNDFFEELSTLLDIFCKFQKTWFVAWQHAQVNLPINRDCCC
jgi:hypothetical protein